MKTTNDAILDAACRHFAQSGFGGASLRAILRDAGVNAAAAHYHFGSKEAVYRAAVERTLAPLMQTRADQFANLSLNQRDPAKNLDALIRAYVTPHLQLCADPAQHNYMTMMARFGAEPEAIIAGIYADIVEPTRKLYLNALTEIVPQVDLDTARRLFGWVTLIMSSSPFEPGYQSMSGHSAMPIDPEPLIDHVVAMSRGGILAVARL
ncbi:MAG: TetR/AcrR family transcriptional regulator [bacterium]